MQAARGSLVFGLASCSSSSERAPRPKGLHSALATMERDRKPGVVVRIPNDPTERAALGNAMASWSAPPAASVSGAPADPWNSIFDAHEVFVEVVFVCLDQEEIERAIPDANPNENLILVDADGRRVAGVHATVADLVSPKAFTAAARHVVHGASRERLRARVARCTGLLFRKTPDAIGGFLTRPLLASDAASSLQTMGIAGADAVGSQGPSATRDELLEQHSALLRAFDPRLDSAWGRSIADVALQYLPYLVQQRIEAPSEGTRLRARALVEATYWMEMGRKETEILPFGARFDPATPPTSSCVCGSASISSRTVRRFVGFAAR